MLALCWWAARRQRLVGAAAVMFVGPLLPVLGLVPFVFQYISTVADRYAYLALLGPAVGLGLWLRGRGPRAYLAVCALLAVLAAVSGAQSRVWADEVTLFRHAIAHHPGSYIGHQNLSYVLFKTGRLPEAIEHARRAVAIAPHPPAWFHLGSLLADHGQNDEAELYLRKALEGDPRHARAHLRSGPAGRAAPRPRSRRSSTSAPPWSWSPAYARWWSNNSSGWGPRRSPPGAPSQSGSGTRCPRYSGRRRTMRIGRRRFVQLLGGAACAVVTPPSSLVALEETRYLNRALGFAFMKPPGWFYLSYQEYSDSGSESDDFDDMRAHREAMGEPVVTIARYHRTPPPFTPAIVVFAEAPMFEPTEASLFDRDLSPIARRFRNFVLEQPATRVLVDGQVASRTEYSYDCSAQGEVGRMKTVLYATIRRDLMYSFNFTDFLVSPYSSSQELAAASDSIRFL